MIVLKEARDFIEEATCPNEDMCSRKIRECSTCPSKDIWNANMWRDTQNNINSSISNS